MVLPPLAEEDAPAQEPGKIYSEGCPAAIAKLPQDGFVVFVCATGARAGEMCFGLKDDCKMDMKRFAYLDAEVMYGPKGPVVK